MSTVVNELAQAVADCRANAPLMAALAELYAQVDVEIAAAGAGCLGGGVCCKFDVAGHRLYVSSGELALLTTQSPPEGRPPRELRCPYQVGPRCAARNVRPLGCRVYFCASDGVIIRHGLYEGFHSEVRRLHDICCAPYAYVELTAAIVQVTP